jgi:hypothetical protein
MINFSETLEAVERQQDLLRSVSDIAVAVDKSLESIKNFRLMLEHSHQKQFQSANQALQYIDTVLLPQLTVIHDSLKTSTQAPLQKLSQARAHNERLVNQLRMFSDGAPDLLP